MAPSGSLKQAILAELEERPDEYGGYGLVRDALAGAEVDVAAYDEAVDQLEREGKLEKHLLHSSDGSRRGLLRRLHPEPTRIAPGLRVRVSPLA